MPAEGVGMRSLVLFVSRAWLASSSGIEMVT